MPMFFKQSDNTLIDKALQGSESSWLKLVRRHENRLYNYCLRMSGNESDAMDLLQEIFLSVFRHLPSWNNTGEFSHWLMRIASNKTIDLHREKQRYPWEKLDSEEIINNSPESLESSPGRQFETQERNRHIMLAMANLPVEKRLLMELKFFQQMTFEEISLQTGIPTNTVKARFYSILKSLKQNSEIRHAL